MLSPAELDRIERDARAAGKRDTLALVAAVRSARRRLARVRLAVAESRRRFPADAAGGSPVREPECAATG